MKIRKIELQGITKHADTTLELPAVGLVVVTGANGSGKSSLVEAVALAAYARTLRGAPVWAEGRARVRLVTDRVEVVRARSGARSALRWNFVGAEPTPWESASRAQEALERELAPWDAWRRGCVFSSSDAAHFSTATDAERKRLLEAALGIDAFDRAVAHARLDLKAAQTELLVARGSLDDARRLVDGARDHARIARDALAAHGLDPAALESAHRVGGNAAVWDVIRGAFPVPAPLAADKLAAWERALRELNTEAHDAAVVRDRALAGGGETRAAAAAAARLVRALGGGTCPTCLRKVPRKQLGELAQDAMAKAADADAEERAARGEGDAATAQLAEIEAARDDLARKIDAARAEARAADAHRFAQERSRATANSSWSMLRDALDRDRAVSETLPRVERDASGCARRVLLLEAAESALGLRGVRAHVLRRGLSVLNAVASAWLPRLGRPDLTVEIRPYVERKSGGAVDAVDVVVGGAGAGHGYRGASAGERRRIDVALLLGVAELAGAASGSPCSTLFFDELFDGLDAAGREAAADALADLAADRAVVVITHDEDLAARLPAAMRVRVEDGRVA